MGLPRGFDGRLLTSARGMAIKEAIGDATAFTKSFGSRLAQLVSDFPKEYWNFFPRYMTVPFRIRIFVGSNGLAIRYVRPSRALRITVSHLRGRLEGTIFPFLSQSNMFFLANTHDSSVSHMTLANKDFADHNRMTGGTRLVCPSDFGVAEIGQDVEFSFEDVRFAWMVGTRNIVLYEYLLWIFSPPATDKISGEFGLKAAESKFGGFLSWAIFDSNNPKSFEVDYAKFLSTAARLLEGKFESLIVRSDVEEEELQEFLCDHRSILTKP